MVDAYTPTKYRISTVTSTGCVGSEINLNILYDSLEVISNRDTFKNIINDIVYVEYGSKKSTTFFKGYSKKFLINRRKVKPPKRFDNQLTIVYAHFENNIKSNVNIKIFRNGKIQMTGLKYMELGNIMMSKVINIIKNIYDNISKEIVDDIKNLNQSNYQICLINSDYKIGFEVKRDAIFKTVSYDYDNVCSYEPCIYPGVKIQYFWNIHNTSKNGICCCKDQSCYDKKKSGDGYSDGECKRITIAIFQSGCIIITGSQTLNQIDDCYEYINKVLYDNLDKIERKQQEKTIVDKIITKVIKLKISAIT